MFANIRTWGNVLFNKSGSWVYLNVTSVDHSGLVAKLLHKLLSRAAFIMVLNDL